jgi:hypothetical protein
MEGAIILGLVAKTGGWKFGPNRWATGGPAKNTGAPNTNGGEKNPQPNGL